MGTRFGSPSVASNSALAKRTFLINFPVPAPGQFAWGRPNTTKKYAYS
jgi:hypothetical protein